MAALNIRQISLTGGTRSRLAGLLGDAFAEDTAMIEMLGAARWQRIARRYFALQFDYSDVILVAEDHSQIVGALLARSPAATSDWRSLWVLARMIALLGRHWTESQRVGHALLARLPQQSHWYINQLAVHPDHQSLGIGQQLLYALGNRTGSDMVCVDCEDSLQGYYEAAGYRLFDALPDHGLRIMANQLPVA